MTAVLLGGIFVLGLLFGSFLNVLISRFPRGMGERAIQRGKFYYYGGRSYCDHCEEILRWYELIPVVSFILLRGRCARCGKSIPAHYALVELLMGFSFALLGYGIFFTSGVGGIPTAALSPFLFWLHAFFLFAVVMALLSIFFFDIHYFTIPDSFTAVIAGAGLFESFIRISVLYSETFYSIAAGMFSIGAFFFALWFFTKGNGMGFGDVKLAAAVPLLIGSIASVAAIIASFWIGAAVSLILIGLGRKGMKDRVPFGPFLVLGTLLLLAFPELSSFLFFWDVI